MKISPFGLNLVVVYSLSACLRPEIEVNVVIDAQADMRSDITIDAVDQGNPSDVITASSCGNGEIEEGESCDGGDHCNENCQICEGASTTRCIDQEVYTFDACGRKGELIETCSEAQRCTLSTEGARCDCEATEDLRCQGRSIYAVNSCGELESNSLETCPPNQECVESINEQSGNRSASCKCLPSVTSYCEEGAVIELDSCGEPSPSVSCEENFRCEEQSGQASCVPLTPCAEQNACPLIEWIRIEGGSYMMGSDLYSDTLPIHEVTLRSFEIMKTPVTIAQYKACVDAGICDPPVCESDDPRCSYHRAGGGSLDIPVSFMSWHMLNRFATWVGARLITEAEWEYTARNQGTVENYPWGDQISCDYALYANCASSYAPVCSRPIGNTAQGVCDMVGGIFEWVQDEYYATYEGAPNDGSGWCTNECPLNTDSETYSATDGTSRIIRGAGLFSGRSPHPSYRYRYGPFQSAGLWDIGGRLARDL